MNYAEVNNLMEILNQQDNQVEWSYIPSVQNDEVAELFKKDLSNPYSSVTKNGRYIGDIVGNYIYVGDSQAEEYLQEVVVSNQLSFEIDTLV